MQLYFTFKYLIDYNSQSTKFFPIIFLLEPIIFNVYVKLSTLFLKPLILLQTTSFKM